MQKKPLLIIISAIVLFAVFAVIGFLASINGSSDIDESPPTVRQTSSTTTEEADEDTQVTQLGPEDSEDETASKEEKVPADSEENEDSTDSATNTAEETPTPTPLPQPQQRLVVSGTVKTPAGEFASNATVSLKHSVTAIGFDANSDLNIQTAQTTEKGFYELEITDWNSYTIQAEFEDMKSDPALLSFSSVRNLLVQRGKAKHSDQEIAYTQDFELNGIRPVTFEVVNTENEPIADAKVSVHYDYEMTVPYKQTHEDLVYAYDATNENGMATVELHFSDIQFKALVTAEGYESETTIITTGNDHELIKLNKIDTEISGVVVDLDTGKPISGASVNARKIKEDKLEITESFSAQTNDKGEFEILGTGPGKFILTISKHQTFIAGSSPSQQEEGYRTKQVETLVKNPLQPGEKRTGIKVELDKGFQITFQFVDAETNEPLSNIKFKQATDHWNNRDNRKEFTSDANGYILVAGTKNSQGVIFIDSPEYFFENVLIPEDYQRVNYYYEEENRKSFSYRLQDDSKTEHFFQVSLTTGEMVRGIVKNVNGTPIPNQPINAMFSLPQSGASTVREYTTSDSNGEFNIFVREGNHVVATTEYNDNTFASKYLKPPFDEDDLLEIQIEETRSIVGFVVDESDQPIQDAEVVTHQLISTRPNSRYYSNRKSIQSDSDGKFEFSDVLHEDVRISAEKEGFAKSALITIKESDGTPENPLYLKLGESFFLGGYVQDLEGSPIEGANINLSNQISSFHESTKSDENGYFYVTGVPGPVQVYVNSHSTEYSYKQYEDFIEDLNRDDHIITLEKYELTDIYVSVVDSITQRAVTDYKAYRLTYDSTDSTEEYEIRDGKVYIPDCKLYHSQRVKIVAEGFPEDLQIFNFSIQDNDYPNDGSVEKVASLQKGLTITGEVIDPDTQQGIPDVEVLLGLRQQILGYGGYYGVPDIRKTRTSADGSFVFEQEKEGELTLLAQLSGEYIPTSLNISPSETNDTNHFVIEADKGKMARVYVTGPDGNRVPGEAVIASFRQNQTTEELRELTDESGMATLRKVPNQNVTFSLERFDIRKTLNLAENSDEVVEVNLEIGGTKLTLEVTKNGKPFLGHLQLSKRDDEGRSYFNTNSLDNEGKAVVEHAPSGNYQAVIYGPNWGIPVADETITIEPGQTEVTKTIEVPDMKVFGKVLDSMGEPVANAEVEWLLDGEIRGSFQVSGSVNTNGKGEFNITQLTKTGTYDLSCEVSGKGVGTARVTLANPTDSIEQDINLKKSGGTIESYAYLLSTGAPLQTAWLKLTPLEGTDYSFQYSDRDSQGYLRAENIPFGTYEVEVSAFGHSVETHEVAVTPEKFEVLNDVLYAAGAVRWVLTNKDGDPLANVPCKIEPLDPESIEAIRNGQTIDSGHFIVRGLYPGEYKMTANYNGKTYTQIVTIFAGNLSYENLEIE